MPDAPQLRDVYEQHVDFVSRLAFRLLGRAEEVDDLVQEVFLVVAERLDTLRDPGAVRSWLAAITVNHVRNRFERRRRRRLFLVERSPEEVENEPSLSEGTQAESRLILRRAFRALEQVPANDRIAWSLRHLQQLPLNDVARLCDCSLATAKRRIRAAQRVLDKELRDV